MNRLFTLLGLPVTIAIRSIRAAIRGVLLVLDLILSLFDDGDNPPQKGARR